VRLPPQHDAVLRDQSGKVLSSSHPRENLDNQIEPPPKPLGREVRRDALDWER
jgi:hypothetical protein